MSPRFIFWRQVRELTVANVKSRYRKTFAGFIWVVLNPIISFIVQYVIFSKVLKIPLNHYSLFLLAGLLPWIFMSMSIDMCTPLILNVGPVLKTFPTNPLVFLSAQILDNLFNFLVAFILLLIPIASVTPLPLAGLFLLPIPIVLMASGVLGISWLLAVFQVFLRDTRFIVGFLLNVLYFATPIFYPIAFVPPHLRWVVSVNPFYILISPFQICLYKFTFYAFAAACGRAVLMIALLGLLTSWYWKKKKNELYLYL